MLSLAARRLIGLAVIVGGVLLLVIGVAKPNPFESKTTYYAEFTSAHGLGAIGRDVRVAGINVGTIGEVERVGDDAVVALELIEEIEVHSDARADMRPHTLFEGSSFVDLVPGSPTAPPLEPGGVIENARTTNYVTLDEAFRVLRPEIRESLKDLAGVGSRTLRGEAISGIQGILRNAPALTRRLAGPARALQGSGRRELARAINGMADTAEAVASREQELLPLNRRLSATTGALTIDSGVPLDGAVAALPGALRELNEGAPALTALVDRLDRFAVAVNPALPDLALGVRDATPLLERTIPLLRRATPLIADLRKIGERVGDSAPTLAQLVRTIDPVADTLGGSVLPVLDSPSRTGPKTYRQLLATFTAANAVFRPYQHPTQNPNGAGHLWQIGTYADFSPPTLPGGIPFPTPLQGGARFGSVACADVDAIDPDAARTLRASGGCR